MNNDLISREYLKKRINERCNYRQAGSNGLQRKAVCNEVFELIDNAPTVDNAYQEGYIDGMLQAEKIYARSQGEWIFASRHCYKCPFCNELSKGKNFCPNCGAELKGGAK